MSAVEPTPDTIPPRPPTTEEKIYWGLFALVCSVIMGVVLPLVYPWPPPISETHSATFTITSVGVKGAIEGTVGRVDVLLPGLWPSYEQLQAGDTVTVRYYGDWLKAVVHLEREGRVFVSSPGALVIAWAQTLPIAFVMWFGATQLLRMLYKLARGRYEPVILRPEKPLELRLAKMGRQDGWKLLQLALLAGVVGVGMGVAFDALSSALGARAGSSPVMNEAVRQLSHWTDWFAPVMAMGSAACAAVGVTKIALDRCPASPLRKLLIAVSVGTTWVVVSALVLAMLI